MSETFALGWIGTGIMGLPMAGHLLDAGWPLTVYTRTKAKAEPLLARGARWASSPRAVAEASEAVFSIVGYPKDVEETILGKDGVLDGLGSGGIICDMTTSDPALAQRIATRARQKGCEALDAPVTGGENGAKQAKLAFFIGGSEKAYQKLQPCFACMGKHMAHFGAAGSGHKAKLANQTAVAGIMFSLCESLLFVQEAGLDVERWLELVAAAGAAGGSPMQTRGRRILKNDLGPGFYVHHFVKDLGLCLQECRRMGIVLPGITLAEEVYRSMQAQGYGKMGTQSLIAWLAANSGRTWLGQAK